MNNNQKAIEEFELLQLHNQEHKTFQEEDLFQSANIFIGWLMKKANAVKKNDSDALFFKSGVKILVKLLKSFRTLLNESQNFRRQSVYWRMKYESVKDQEQIQETLMNHLHRLVQENEKLKSKQ